MDDCEELVELRKLAGELKGRGQELETEVFDLQATVKSLEIILGDIYGRAWDGLKEVDRG